MRTAEMQRRLRKLARYQVMPDDAELLLEASAHLEQLEERLLATMARHLRLIEGIREAVPLPHRELLLAIARVLEER